ncbi:uncharacterized protein N7515_006603 [Penicillium bovifimosum]|uniref:Uncharacterized protein n=1 Tax=Penicillium bovifimosum TaxID=126998 RepID=A0A9W9L0X4_9EURO|nr:uncharacterized protein N7515_006603 [Penicillium bovifimosum]KAJ5130564.1 hypothetical protein N7515_006603 [Penicillium bovifimosum]
MDNEIPLPPPRRIRHRSPAKSTNPSTAVSSFYRAGRLSRFDDRSSQPSSDPALFSSDDIPASGLENYHATVSGAGRKRRYRGTWWGEQVADPKRKRAEFREKRNFDSGVWMGSDEPGSESLLTSEDGSNWGEDLRKTVLDPRPTGLAAPPSMDSGSVLLNPAAAFQRTEESEAQRFARVVVGQCLEKGQEHIDLGGFQLGSLPPGLLQPLKHLTKLPSFTEPPATENAFTSLQPFLRIYLPNNSLSALPNDVFELNNLRVLSLRSNKFTEIPPAIGRLTDLEVLNLSVNRLTYLPWELLKLIQQGKLNHVISRPNPFHPIEEAQIETWHCKPEPDSEPEEEPEPEPQPTTNSTLPKMQLPLRIHLQLTPPPSLQLGPDTEPNPVWAPILVATGPTNTMDMDGKPVQPTPYNRPSETTSKISNAPSLRELALRAVSKLPYLDQTTDQELADFPPLIVPLLQRAREVRLAGGQTCSVCGREYVLPRTEWMEWWDISPHESGVQLRRCNGMLLRPLPFRRFGCSLSCVPSV